MVINWLERTATRWSHESVVPWYWDQVLYPTGGQQSYEQDYATSRFEQEICQKLNSHMEPAKNNDKKIVGMVQRRMEYLVFVECLSVSF